MLGAPEKKCVEVVLPCVQHPLRTYAGGSVWNTDVMMSFVWLGSDVVYCSSFWLPSSDPSDKSEDPYLPQRHRLSMEAVRC